jgi:uncharacterized phage infection (PIP) family protein YhgE
VIARLKQGTAADEPDASSELARLRASLSDAERALQEAQRTDAPSFAHGDAEMRALRSTVEDQTAELTRLRSELAALNAQRAAAGPAVTENTGALAAKISILEAESAQQAAIILSLRAEIAAGNEKLARQAEFYMNQMKNLAAGTRPAAPPAETASTPLAAQRLSLAERMNAPRVAPVHLPNAATSIASNENEAEQSSRDEENSDVNAGSPRRQSLLQRITGLEKPVA